MVEYSLIQFMGLMVTLTDFMEMNHVTPEQAMKFTIRLRPPKSNGDVQFDLGIPRIDGLDGRKMHVPC